MYIHAYGLETVGCAMTALLLERDAKTDAALQSSSASKYSQLSSFASEFCSGSRNGLQPQALFWGKPFYWGIWTGLTRNSNPSNSRRQRKACEAKDKSVDKSTLRTTHEPLSSSFLWFMFRIL